MASTITLTGDWLLNTGNAMMTKGTGNLGVYATAGIAVTAAQVGLGVIQSLVVDPAGGYTFSWNASTGKVLAYAASSGAFTAAGTNTAPTITSGTAATTTTPLYTNSGAITQVTGAAGITGVQAPVFAGSAVAVSVAEVTTSTNLAGVTFNFRAVGY